MRLLLDTHAFLWAMADAPRLSRQAAMAISQERDVYISAVTAWEISIKRALGKLQVPDDLAKEIRDLRFRELPITIQHAVRAGSLPNIHGDPFDRMLVAQALDEGMIIVTSDKRIAEYGVAVLPAAR